MAGIMRHKLVREGADQVLAQGDEAGQIVWHPTDHLGTVHDQITRA